MFAWIKTLSQSRVPSITKFPPAHPPMPKRIIYENDNSNSIYIKGINSKGETCVTCSMSTFNASAEIQVMTGAVELARAIKRGVPIEPQKFYDLVVGQFLKSVENAWDGKD